MLVANPTLDISRYTIISKIGEGGFSEVFRVKDLTTDEYYAAKISNFMIDEDTKESEETLLLFREVNLMSILNHPSILKFIGYYPINFDDDPCPTIITELAVNGSLRDIIKMETAGLSPDDWNFTKKLINIYGIASGMSYLHSHNIIHRDLKPANILIDEYFYPKISDLGISKITDFFSNSMNIQSRKGIKRTAAYMSPETISNNESSQSGDVYSFGFIVFEILTNEEPFKNFSFLQIMTKVMIQGYRPNIKEDVPNAYCDLIERCWSQDPEKRPTFETIVDELKNSSEFITDLIDKEEFNDYVEYIDKYQTTFDFSKRAITFADFIKTQGRDKTIKTFTFDETTSSFIIKTNEEIITNIEKNSHDKLLFPLSEYYKLSKENQSFVLEAEKESEKQFEVGKFLIEGDNGFQINIRIGLQYIEQSVDQNCLNTIIYYIKILIKIIQQNFKKANKLLSQIKSIQDKKNIFIKRINQS